MSEDPIKDGQLTPEQRAEVMEFFGLKDEDTTAAMVYRLMLKLKSLNFLK